MPKSKNKKNTTFISEEKNMILSKVYEKLEEAKQDLKTGNYSSFENAVLRIKKSYGL